MAKDNAATHPIEANIERLLSYSLKYKLLEALDVVPARNALMDLLHVQEPYAGNRDKLDIPVQATDILEPMLDYAYEAGLMEGNHTTARDLMDARIMGLLMPRESEVARTFYQLRDEESARNATGWFYALSAHSNYIRMDRIRRNQYWESPTAFGNLEITINLSKPEKDPKEIAMLQKAKKSSYPKCLLCFDNVGYAGRADHPGRQNHRVIPLSLSGESWYLQYSPYVYYNEHCIVLNEKHTPMAINPATFQCLLDFIQQLPHYFIGSNADLPIVGGSILSHDHFQGGQHTFAMEKAPVQSSFAHPDFPNITVGIVQWPMSVIRLSGMDTQQLVAAAGSLLDAWRSYSDAEADILAESQHHGELVRHNTITPIARKNGKGDYEFDLVLRNNRTSDQHPEGIFHPHKELHHIKKENIGLIEVMGLAVLPGRLKNDLESIEAILSRGQTGWEKQAENSEDSLHQHTEWIHEMISRYGTSLSCEEAKRCLQQEIGQKFLTVLEHAGVFKQNPAGQSAFGRFLSQCGFIPS